jgi:hypothetical protein
VDRRGARDARSGWLHPAAHIINCGVSQPHHMEGIKHTHRVRQARSALVRYAIDPGDTVTCGEYLKPEGRLQ